MEEDMKCPACSKPFTLNRLPIKSPCKHTACNQCVFLSCSNNSFHCPLCRACSPVTSDKLPINSEIYHSMMKHLNSRCKEHNKHHNWYCSECNKLLCKRCISLHNRHSFLDIDDHSLAAMIAEKVETTHAKLKGPLTDLAEYTARLHTAADDLECTRAKIQQDITQLAKQICTRVKSAAKDSVQQLQTAYSEARATLTGLIESAEEEHTRWKESYADFRSTAGSMKTLDVCSQLKLVDRLSAWPSFEPRDREEPEDRLEDLREIMVEFAKRVNETFPPPHARTPRRAVLLSSFAIDSPNPSDS